MSNHLTSLAYKVNVGSLLRKSVLVLLADKASDDGSGIWASKQTMADELCCSKQAVIKSMNEFQAEGLLRETGTRKNPNGYTVTYTLNVAAIEALPKVKRWAADQSTPLTGQSGSPVNDVDVTSQPGLPKPPLTPLGSEAKASSPKARAKYPAPDGVEEQTWRDFLSSPKRKKAGMSATAYAGICNNLNRLAEHGFPPGEMIALAVERGWTTVKLDWVTNDGRHQQHPGLGKTSAAFVRLGDWNDDRPM